MSAIESYKTRSTRGHALAETTRTEGERDLSTLRSQNRLRSDQDKTQAFASPEAFAFFIRFVILIMRGLHSSNSVQLRRRSARTSVRKTLRNRGVAPDTHPSAQFQKTTICVIESRTAAPHYGYPHKVHSMKNVDGSPAAFRLPVSKSSVCVIAGHPRSGSIRKIPNRPHRRVSKTRCLRHRRTPPIGLDLQNPELAAQARFKNLVFASPQTPRSGSKPRTRTGRTSPSQKPGVCITPAQFREPNTAAYERTRCSNGLVSLSFILIGVPRCARVHPSTQTAYHAAMYELHRRTAYVSPILISEE